MIYALRKYWHRARYRHEGLVTPGVGTLSCCVGRRWWPFAIVLYRPDIKGGYTYILPSNDIELAEAVLAAKTPGEARDLLVRGGAKVLPGSENFDNAAV